MVAEGPSLHAVTTAGRIALVSGQVALDADEKLAAPGDLAAQIRQPVRNLGRILAVLRADWPDVALRAVLACTWVSNDINASSDAWPASVHEQNAARIGAGVMSAQVVVPKVLGPGVRPGV